VFAESDCFSQSIGTTVPTVNVSATALRFFFKVTLKRHDLAEEIGSGARQERRQSPAPGRNRPGYLANLEARRGRPARIGLDDPIAER
jgi:hypothetical protein